MDKDFLGLFNDIKGDLTKYVNLRMKLLKIETYEKAGKIAASLSFVLVLMFIVFFAVLFLFLGLGYYLGQWLNDQAMGMCLIGGLYLIILAIVILFRKQLTSKIFSLFVSELMDGDNDDED